MITNIKKELLAIVITAIVGILYVAFRADTGPAAPAPAAPPSSSRLSELLGQDGTDVFPLVTEARPFRFPADHGPHPEYRNEWWYVTGNLDAATGERFGFELTIFRFALTPSMPGASGWRTNQVYVGHFAITDVAEERFHVRQRYSRSSLGLAGASADPFAVWIEDWSIRAAGRNANAAGDIWRLRARDGDVGLDVTLAPLKQPILNGVSGLSKKSAEPGNASYYYSVSRLATSGTLQVGGRQYEVSGLSWLDREWGSSALSTEQQGWDWFALQLSDGSDLMFYSLRRRDGTRDDASAGTWIAADGTAEYLASDDVTIEILEHWDSPAGGRYPAAWSLDVPRFGVELTVRPVITDQELMTIVRYWEGAVDVVGRHGREPVGGRGYVELTGYAERPGDESG